MAIFLQLIGQTAVGKSSVARRLAALKHGTVLPFAKDVYRLASIVKGGQIDKSRPEDRELLKLIGTTWGRESRALSRDIQDKLDRHKPKEWGTPDIWAKIFVSTCRSLPPTMSIVNDDTRFLNELEISMGSLGFIPLLVACHEDTRQKRLRKRGEMRDPNATNHLSEELANFLGKRALREPLLTVIWNDRPHGKPQFPWVYQWSDLRIVADEADSNSDLARELRWTPERARALLATIKSQLDCPR